MNRAPVFAINLERSPERRATALAAFRAVGVDLQIYKAVDGRQQDLLAHPSYDRATRIARFGIDLNPPEIACYLSHLAVFEHCLKAGVERAVIVEDDVHPAAHFAEALDALSAAPTEFEFVRLIGTRPRPSLSVADLTADVRLVWPRHGLCGAQGYYLTRGAMEKLLARSLPIILPFDMMLDRYWRTGITIFALDPYVVRDAGLDPSDIGKRPDAWDERPRPWLRARLRAGKIWERGARMLANSYRRARLLEWRRIAQAAFANRAHPEGKSRE